MPIRLALISGSSVLRQGIHQITDGTGEIGLIDNDADAPVRVVAGARPDVILVHANSSEHRIRGIAAEVAELGTDRPAVILMTGAEHTAEIWPAVRAGVDGYLREVDRPEEIIAAIRAVAAGDAWLSPPMARTFLDYCRENTIDRADHAGASTPLTARELSVVRLIARGLSNAELATELTISESTVKTHVSRILHKLELRDRTQLARFAYENELT